MWPLSRPPLFYVRCAGSFGERPCSNLHSIAFLTSQSFCHLSHVVSYLLSWRILPLGHKRINSQNQDFSFLCVSFLTQAFKLSDRRDSHQNLTRFLVPRFLFIYSLLSSRIGSQAKEIKFRIIASIIYIKNKI
jgi:hypothetical protein